MAAEAVWYVKSPREEMVYGPYGANELRQLAQMGRLRADFIVSQDKKQWHGVEEILSGKTTIPKPGSEKAVTKRIPESGQQTQMFGDYQILQELGRGGSGIVYKAMELPMKRVVALKVLINKGQDAREVQRFSREISVTAKMEHPHIVHIFHCGDTPQPFFTMEYIQGKPLNHLIRDGVLSMVQKLEIFCKILSAIEYAHKQKIVHRDIKPCNVLMDGSGEPKVTDFGLARSLNSQEMGKLSLTGEILGTPQYMSPEQADGKEVDQRTDIYSLGALLYELLTGRPPFDGDTIINILAQLANDEPLPPHALKAGIPLDVETICLKCLHKNPQRRYRSVAMLRQEIERFQQNKPISARPPGAAERAQKWVRRNKLASVVAGSVFLCLLFGLVALIYYIKLTAAETQAQNKIQVAKAALKQQEIAQIYQRGCEYFHAWQFKSKERTDATDDCAWAFSSVIEQDKAHYQAHWLRGCTRFALGDVKEARKDFAQVYDSIAQNSKVPDTDKIKLCLLLALCDGHDHVAAQKWWDEAQQTCKRQQGVLPLSDYLKLLAERNQKPTPVYFRQPLPDEEHSLEKARYHLLMPLLPQNVAEEAYRRSLVVPDAERETFLKECVAPFAGAKAKSFNEETLFKEFVRQAWIEQLYKLQYLLFEQREGWINHIIKEQEPTNHTLLAELKDMIFYVQGQWILDMASPYWVYLRVEEQQKYAGLYQQGYAAQLKEKEGVWRTILYKDANSGRQTTFRMVLLPPGQFLMGTPYAINNEGPQHQVVVLSHNWMAATELTQEQLKDITGETPWDNLDVKLNENNKIRIGPDYPAIGISVNYVTKRVIAQEPRLQIPDEILWEYACRAGTTLPFYWGKQANKEKFWYADNAWDIGDKYAHQVKQKQPNPWGLYDIIGNAYEICRNSWWQYTATRSLYDGSDKGIEVNPQNQIYRGGSFAHAATECRAAFRTTIHPLKINGGSCVRLILRPTR